MKVLLLMLAFCLLPGSKGLTVCSDPLNTAANCTDLDSALAEANNFPNAVLTLQVEGRDFVLHRSVTLISHVQIQGNAQRLVLSQSITLQKSAELEIYQVRISLGTPVPPIEQVFTLFGLLFMQECVIEGFSLAVVGVYGHFYANNCTLDGNRKEIFLLKQKEAVISIETTQISRQTAPFLSASLKPALFHMHNCTVSQTIAPLSSAFLHLDFPTDAESGRIWISHLQYSDNKASFLSVDLKAVELVLIWCEFSRNEGSGVVGYMVNSLVNVTNCTWTHNRGLSMRLLGFSGLVLVANSNFSYQYDAGFVQIAGKSAFLCTFSLSQCSFAHTNVTLTTASPGVLALSDCTAEVTLLSVVQVRYWAEKYTDQQALIYATSAVLAITDLVLTDSGSSGLVISLGNGVLNLGNCLLRNPFTGQNLYIGLMLGRAHIGNVTIEGGDAALSANDIMLGYVDPVFFYFMQATASMERIQVSKQTLYHTGATLCFFFSDLSVSGLQVWDLVQYFVVLAGASSGLVADLEVSKVDLDFYVCQAASYTNLTISNATIQALTPNVRAKAVFFMSSYCHMSVFRTLLRDLSAPTVISSKSSLFDSDFLSIFNCSFRELAQYPLNSRINFRNLVFEESVGGLASGMESQISFTHSYIRKVRSETGYFRCFTSAVRLVNLTVAGYYSHLQLGRFSESSSFFISNSRLSDFGSVDGRGFSLQDGNLSVSNSHFSHFNVSLFQGLGIAVFLGNSSFGGGYSTVTSLKSDYAYGGVLGCVDCGKVEVRGVRVTNVSAEGGGALALRPRKGLVSTTVEIEGSSFSMNSAQQGGAIYIQNASFSISNSSFLSNKGKFKGGAVLASIRPSEFGHITHTVFTYNSAMEGGAIKWENAEIVLRNVSFRGNSAQYGPDIASYGVTLSSKLTVLPDSPVSGQPVSLVFELLDHYGALVSMEKNKALALLSTATVSYRGNSLAFIASGLFSFPSLTIYAPPGTSTTLTGSLSYSQGDYSLALQGFVSVAFRNCSAGEIYRSDRCDYCYAGNFSFSPSDSACSFCPRNAMCFGGSEIAVNAHYWRAARNSTNIVKCALPGLCLGGNSSCAQGYTGKACLQCSEQWYQYAAVKCGKCRGTLTSWVHIAAMCLVTAGFIWMLFGFLGKSPDSDKLFVLKTVITHSQLLSATAYMRVMLPDPVAYTLYALSFLSTFGITDLPLACLGLSAPNTLKAAAAFLICPASVLLFLVFSRYQDNLPPKLPVFLLTSLLLQAPIVAILCLMPLLTCLSIDSEQEWQFTDISQQCWTASHFLDLSALVVPGAILGLLVPVFLVISLLLARPGLYQAYFPLWTCGYRVASWELLHLLGRVVYAGLMIRVVVHDQLVQICSGLCVLIVISVLNVSFQQCTYTHKGLFALAELSLAITAVSLGFEGYLMYDYTVESSRSKVISGLFIGLNGGFYVLCAYLLVQKRKEADIGAIERSPSLAVPPNSQTSHLSR